ncbi:exported hypothetical protein [Candidatus Xenohaliotis californiensis]|uniref:OmpA-like domain-containing protein n=1 Tax=Candidatus Xenohaliotis californiensis TaxID=84677 RepID=A0ABM9N7H5_9RICK|nr:exported hypothetical protein [Candidatus Xenohaliotis californiensis]
MKKIGALFVACFFLISATGFSVNWKKVNFTKPEGTSYQNDLGMQLKRLANEEVRARNWKAANYFADKAINSFKGHNILPYNPKGWVYSSKVSYNELLVARKMLLELQNNTQKEKHPHLLARMTADFDCWGVRQQANRYIATALKCRDNFFKIANYLDRSSKYYNGHINQVSKIISKEKNYDNVYKMDLVFGWSATSLSKSELCKIDKITDYLNSIKGNYSVVLIGHADQTGGHKVNHSFSYARAITVRKELISVGIPKNKIKLYAMSKDMPIVNAEGKKRLVNRRVEVYVLDNGYAATVNVR